MITIIVAYDENRVIGKEGKIPWHNPKDLKLFKENTINKTIVMGRKTWDSLPNKPLPNRRNVVLTSNPIEHVECRSSIEDVVRNIKEDIYVIGGSKVYQEFLDKNLVDNLWISEIPGKHDGDIFFPNLDLENDWEFHYGNWIGDSDEKDAFLFRKYRKNKRENL